jgi:PAS domain S-box-containing protein
LRESEQRYRLLAENITDVIWTLDTNLKTTYVSPSVTRQRGYTIEEAMALPLEMQTSPETMDMIRRVIAEELALEFSGQADPAGWRRGEGIAYRTDGAQFWVEVTASFLRNPEGQIVGVMGVTRDITERKKAEEALRESEERFRTLIENAQDGISIAEPDGTMRYVSPSTERILGFKPEELVGKNVTEFLHPDDVYNAFEPRPRLLGEPETLMSQIYRLRHKDGSWRVIEATNKNLLEDPKVRGIVSNFRDITERKEGEESLARYAAELMCSNKELEQFAFIASHDLQEPLRLMRIYVQLFAKRYQGKLDSDADEFVGYIVSSARRMQELIDGLLAYSLVVVPGKEVQEVDCEATLDRALGSLHTAVEESGVMVTHGSLPHVIGDGLQLEQLFQNLIDNAIKFRSEETPRIHVSAEEKAGEWIFSVQDNGIGIDPEFAERIFVVFKRLHREEDYPGAGVGLTLCRKIVERHNGRIWVESEAGKGATFRFTIPVSGVEHP